MKSVQGNVAMVPWDARRDPYQVLGVAGDASDKDIKTAYRKLALRYHPDKNTNNPEAVEFFKEVAYSYSILSDPEKRRQYDSAGFQGLELEAMDMEVDLSTMGTVHTAVVALFRGVDCPDFVWWSTSHSKLGVPIKTSVSATVLEDAMNGRVSLRSLPIGSSISDEVEKQGAHFFRVTITEEQAKAGIVIRVVSTAQSKFKLLYFEQEANGCYGLSLQEDSVKAGKVTSAGMYFLHFQCYRLHPVSSTLEIAKDPETAIFRKLEGLQPCEISELQSGTHIFAVYGDNFFKNVTYSIEAICTKSFEKCTERFKDVEALMLAKRDGLRQFEVEYKKALAHFHEVNSRYAQEKHAVDELLRLREDVRSSFTVTAINNRNSHEGRGLGFKEESLKKDSLLFGKEEKNGEDA
eukprot:Gb_03293 [translate_table: standard]